MSVRLVFNREPFREFRKAPEIVADLTRRAELIRDKAGGEAAGFFVDGKETAGSEHLYRAAVYAHTFEAALHGLWTRLDPTLGEVTLSAIAERVLHNAAEKYPFFAALEIELPTGIKNAEKREQIGDVKDTELLAGMRFVVIELLTLLGNLTAEILTPELHAELDKAVAANPGRVVKGKRK